MSIPSGLLLQRQPRGIKIILKQGQEREQNILTVSDRITIPMVAVEIFNYPVNCAANCHNRCEKFFSVIFFGCFLKYQSIFYVCSQAFGSRLVSLIRQALNWKTWGMMSRVAVLTASHPGRNKQASHSSSKCSLAASQAENKKANHLKGVYASCPGKLACSITPLKCLCTKAHSMGCKHEELEVCEHSQGHDFIAARDMVG